MINNGLVILDEFIFSKRLPHKKIKIDFISICLVYKKSNDTYPIYFKRSDGLLIYPSYPYQDKQVALKNYHERIKELKIKFNLD